MKELLAHFKVVNGAMEYRNVDYVALNIEKFEGCSGILHIKKKWNKRSNKQNRYFWLCMGVLSEHTGHTPEEMHTIVKGLYCPKKQIKVGKKEYSVPKGTSELSKGEFVELMLNIDVLASELGVVLPRPEDLYKPY
jgi:hypothetical protein